MSAEYLINPFAVPFESLPSDGKALITALLCSHPARAEMHHLSDGDFVASYLSLIEAGFVSVFVICDDAGVPTGCRLQLHMPDKAPRSVRKAMRRRARAA